MASPGPFPDNADPYSNRRAYPRVSVALPAFLQAHGARHHVQLLDVSAGGARLSCAATLPPGTAVTLDCGTLGRTGLIRWQNGAVLGLCFDSELDAREVSALINRSDGLAARMKSQEAPLRQTDGD